MTIIHLDDFKKKIESLPEDEHIVDVRSALEHSDVKINGVQNIPLDQLHEHLDTLKQYKNVYLICASGNRSSQAQQQLTAAGITSYSVQGGMQLWEQSNLPIIKNTKSIPVIRQVFIVAGSLIILSTILSLVAHQSFVFIALFVGAGLLFSGVSGWCGMAKLLELMPWNKITNTTNTPQSCCSTTTCDIIETTEQELEWQEADYSVRQFVNPGLAHYSYAIISGTEMAIVDPGRNPQPYYDYAAKRGVTINAVFETHPHADFVSAHKEIASTTGATIYVSPLVGAEYTHTPFKHRDTYAMGNIVLECLDTPGHSPDSISILVKAKNKAVELFSGDTLFVGDVGRPDLREAAGNITAQREELAGHMYETVTTILKNLPDDVRVFPAHGAGSLCGKSLGSAPFTAIGAEKQSNPAFATQTKAEFIQRLTSGQPFIPKYFTHDVGINKQGATTYEQAINSIQIITTIPANALVIDTRSGDAFVSGHLAGALHIANGKSFETWLGALIAPNEPFTLVVETQEEMDAVVQKIANIGYEHLVLGVYIGAIGTEQMNKFTSTEIDSEQYTIIDVRNNNEVEENIIFKSSLHIPLAELRERLEEIPDTKPIIVHCAGGYRSSIATSIIQATGKKVYDLSTAVENWS